MHIRAQNVVAFDSAIDSSGIHVSRLFTATPRSKQPAVVVMLSGVGANATTQSKHPGAASGNNADTGSATENADSDKKAREELLEAFWALLAFSECFGFETRRFARLFAQHDRV